MPVSNDVIIHSWNCKKEINSLVDATYYPNYSVACLSYGGEERKKKTDDKGIAVDYRHLTNDTKTNLIS